MIVSPFITGPQKNIELSNHIGRGRMVWMDLAIYYKFRKRTNLLRIFHLIRVLNARHSGEVRQSAKQIADILDITPQTVNRHISWMKQEGWILEYGKSGRFYLMSINKIKDKYGLKGRQIVDINPTLDKRTFESAMFAYMQEGHRKTVAFRKKTKPTSIASKERELRDVEVSVSFICNSLHCGPAKARFLIGSACEIGLISYSYQRQFCQEKAICFVQSGWFWSEKEHRAIKNDCAKIRTFLKTSKRRR